MRVRMRTLYAGPFQVVQPGEWVDVSQKEAENLIARGYAEPLGPPSQPDPRGGPQAAAEAVPTPPAAPETAELPPGETTEAVGPVPRRRRRAGGSRRPAEG